MTERSIPVIINNRNLVTWVQEMVRRIERYASVGEIVIVDNASDYEPLLDWYETKPCRIVRLQENLGHYSPWSSGTVARFKSGSYVVTDPDMGLETTPDDTLLHLQSKLDASTLCKVGLGLDWESVPVDSPYYRHVQSYEIPVGSVRHRRRSVHGGCDRHDLRTVSILGHRLLHRRRQLGRPLCRQALSVVSDRGGAHCQ